MKNILVISKDAQIVKYLYKKTKDVIIWLVDAVINFVMFVVQNGQIIINAIKLEIKEFMNCKKYQNGKQY